MPRVPMKASEAVKCKAANIGGFRAFTVANDALTVVVSKDNTWATCLTVAELKKIWEPGSKVNNWNQVRSSFPNESLKLFGPGTDSGTFDYFTEVDQREIQGLALRLLRARGRQRARPGRVRDEGRHGVLRVLVLRGEQGQAQGSSRSRIRRRASA